MPQHSLDPEMEQAKATKGKCTDNKDCCKTVVRVIHLVLHVVLFILFMEFFGIPSVQKYIDQDTIVISSEEQTNGIESPAITIAALGKTPGQSCMKCGVASQRKFSIFKAHSEESSFSRQKLPYFNVSRQKVQNFNI